MGGQVSSFTELPTWAKVAIGVPALATSFCTAYMMMHWDRRLNTTDNILSVLIYAFMWKKILKISTDDKEGKVQALRDTQNNMTKGMIPGKGWSEEIISVPVPQASIPVHIFRVDGAKRDRPAKTLVWFHGGGMALGGAQDGAMGPFLKHIRSNHPETVVASVEYRMAPEHRFPVAHEDCVAAAVYLHSHASDLGLDPKHFVFSGASAGGNLCFTTAAAVRGRVPVKFQLPIIPMCNPAMTHPSYTENADARSLSKPVMEWFWRAYLGPNGQDAGKDPRANPLATDMKGMPPTVIVTARFDPMRDEGVELYDLLRKAGVTTSHIMVETSHAFFMLANPDNGPILRALDHGLNLDAA